MMVANLFLFAFLPLLVASKDTIAVNQTLKDGEFLITKENNFVLGFFSPGHSKYRYLGVWFHKVSELTPVWVANRDFPINGSSGALKLHRHGELVLFADSDQKVAVWSSNVFQDVKGAYFAQLLDSGNLVLVQVGSSGKRIVWQSFDYPTNTLMNGITIGLNRKTGRELFLTSWRSADDPGTGDYSFKISPDGPPQFFLHKGTNNYWRSCLWPWRSFASAYNDTDVNNEDGVYIIDHLYNSAGIRRVVLDESGFMRDLFWDISDSVWKENWAVPRYRCDSFGDCGSFGKCNVEKVESLECNCLPGYEPESLGDRNLRNGRGRCIKKRNDSSLACGQKGGFLKVANAKIPDASQAVWVSMNMSQVDCERQCMRDILCLAYASVNVTGRGSGCLAWYGQLMETIDFTDEGYDLYICVDALQLAQEAGKSSGSLEMKGILAILIPSVALGWIVIILIACFWIKKRKKRGKNHAKKMVIKSTSLDFYKDNFAAKNHGERRSHPELEFFDLDTVYAATENFSHSNKLGQGGFGSVYKGQLSDGQEVAVKRLSKNSGQGMEELANEVILIAKLQHRNLVKLLGCCIEGEEPMLIYEYLPNKSLDLFLFDQTRRPFLDWRRRFDIIVGIARGIMYLHHDSRLKVIHRDLKSSNILLDAEMNPKISDFGMARIFNDEQNQDKTKRVVGTYGYMSPEYAVFGKFSVKSDVFSFGVILLEIIIGKKNTDFYQDDTTLSLIGYVWDYWRRDGVLEVVDSSLKESCPPQEALRCIQIGLLCVQEYAGDRPIMSDVVLMLNSDMPLPYPKRPAFVFMESKNDLDLLVGEKPYSINLVTISDILSR